MANKDTITKDTIKRGSRGKKGAAPSMPVDAVNPETGAMDDAALLAELLKGADASPAPSKPDEILDDAPSAPVSTPELLAADPELAELEAALAGELVSETLPLNLPMDEAPEAPAALAATAEVADPELLALADVLADAEANDQAALANAAVGDNVVPEPEKPSKPPRTPRDVCATKSEKIAKVLGEKKAEFLALEIADADLSAEELEAKQKATLAAIDKLAKKVGEKSVMLFGYLRSGGRLNEVMRRAFEVLLRDGELTSGDKGNLQINLMSKPYSLGTSRSQSNQIFALFPALKITKREKGRMVPNPDSTILMKFKSESGK